ENPDRRIGARGRKDERGLREIELQGKCLHPLGIQRTTGLEHTQRIAAEPVPCLGEDVDDAVREGPQCVSFTTSQRTRSISSLNPPADCNVTRYFPFTMIVGV